MWLHVVCLIFQVLLTMILVFFSTNWVVRLSIIVCFQLSSHSSLSAFSYFELVQGVFFNLWSWRMCLIFVYLADFHNFFHTTQKKKQHKNSSQEKAIPSSVRFRYLLYRLTMTQTETRFTLEEIVPDSWWIRNVLVPDWFCRLHTRGRIRNENIPVWSCLRRFWIRNLKWELWIRKLSNPESFVV